MARGTQHRKRRPRANARPAAAVAAPAKAKRRQKPPQWQDQLFFSRLRNHAKWIYVALAIAFAATFALLGVGSGSTGISGALSNFFSSNGSSGPSITKLQKKVQDHPNSAADWRALATALEQKHQTSDAINALERYSQLRPKDVNALTELAGQYAQQATNLQTQAQDAQTKLILADPSQGLVPSGSTPLGKVFTSTTGLKSPITNVIASTTGNDSQALYTQYTELTTKQEDVYKKVVALTPTDASAQIQLAQAALNANDRPTAIKALTRFLKIAPTDPEAAYARSTLKQLQPAKKK